MKALPSPVLQAHQVDGFDAVVYEAQQPPRRRPPVALTVLTLASLAGIAWGLVFSALKAINPGWEPTLRAIHVPFMWALITCLCGCAVASLFLRPDQRR